MRKFGLLFLIFLCSSFVRADTFILNSGKRIQGTIQYREKDTIRIIDDSGIPMTLKRSSIKNIEATAPSPAVSETFADNRPAMAERQSRVFNNHDIASFKVHEKKAVQNIKEEIRKAERDFSRLKEACRSAGKSSPSMQVLTTKVYIVHGKPVTVTGYWAHPANIENAKRICSGAIEAEQHLNELQKESDNTSQTSSQPSGSAASIGLNR